MQAVAGVAWNVWMGLKFGIIIPLIVAGVFRLATLQASPDRFWCQKFVFLGGCSQPNPPYTPWRILLNRSLARPLVRYCFVYVKCPIAYSTQRRVCWHNHLACTNPQRHLPRNPHFCGVFSYFYSTSSPCSRGHICRPIGGAVGIRQL
jgi:hypothetical protein